MYFHFILVSLLLPFSWQKPNSHLHEESRDVKLQMDVCEPPPVTVEGTRREREDCYRKKRRDTRVEQRKKSQNVDEERLLCEKRCKNVLSLS